MYDFIRGPMVWISFIIFASGLAFQIYKLFAITRKKEARHIILENVTKEGPAKLKEYLKKTISAIRLKRTVLGIQPYMTILTFLFHTSIILTPFFVLGHNILIFESWRFRFFSLSEFTTDIISVVFLACAAMFLIRRIFVPRVRAVSGIYDYLLLLVTSAPFITGFLAYHQLVDYKTILTIHILTGELMLIAVGLTKLGHMVFFFFVRLNIGTEYSFRGGSRSWQ